MTTPNRLLYANQNTNLEHRNAIDLWEYTKNIEPAFN